MDKILGIIFIFTTINLSAQCSTFSKVTLDSCDNVHMSLNDFTEFYVYRQNYLKSRVLFDSLVNVISVSDSLARIDDAVSNQIILNQRKSIQRYKKKGRTYKYKIPVIFVLGIIIGAIL